ncbi:MAG TPA: hypothetical protein VEX60_14815 [Pyrinomonadaceae bacterium]|nr:hypothetical protein [Pyrinomonadaceae bacterium]
MKRTLFTLLIVAASCITVFAQDGQERQNPFQVDAFGDILISDFLARADHFAIEIQNNPSAKAYIVAYIVPNKFPGFPLRRANWARGYLMRGRGIDSGRVEVINGGYRDEVRFEFWLTDSDSKPPVTPFDFSAALSREKKPFLFDRIYYPLPSPDETGIESGYIGYLDEEGWYEPFVTALRSDPASRGCVIAYAASRNRRGSDRVMAASVKRAIMRTHAIGADRIVPIAGGRRPHKGVELWIVPPGAELPKPSPTVRPKKRKR